MFELPPVAPPGFGNRGGVSEVRVYRGSRVRSPPVPVVLSVYQRDSLLDGLAMYLSCDTKKFHDNDSTHSHLGPYRLFPRDAMLARVLAMALCLSVTSRSSIETADRIKLIFCVDASFDLSYSVLQGTSGGGLISDS